MLKSGEEIEAARRGRPSTRRRPSCACSIRRSSIPTTCSTCATTGHRHGLEGEPRALGAPALHGARGRRTSALAAGSTSAPRSTPRARLRRREVRRDLEPPVPRRHDPDATDPSLAPAGRTSCRRTCSTRPTSCRTGRWAEAASEVAETRSRRSRRTLPGLAALVVGRQVLTPKDLERPTASPAATPCTASRRSTSSSLMRPLLGLAATARPRAASTCAAPAHIPAAASPAARPRTPRARS